MSVFTATLPKRSGPRFTRLALHVALIVVAAFFIYPLLWILMTAFKSPAEIARSTWDIPHGLDFANFIQAWQMIKIDRLLFNSLFVSVTATMASTGFALAAAYSLARSQNRLLSLARLLFLGAMFFPLDIAMVSLFVELRSLRLLNTYAGLIAPYIAFNLPISVLILTKAIRQVPGEILDSATVDGANSWQILWRVLTPVIWPSIAAAAVLSFVNNWNEFLVALIATSNPAVKTLPVGIAGFLNRTNPQYNLLFAGIVISTVPMIAVFLTLQRQFIAGITSGAVK
jgi:raffinose/stachyose/melibiose transport system permease protein